MNERDGLFLDVRAILACYTRLPQRSDLGCRFYVSVDYTLIRSSGRAKLTPNVEICVDRVPGFMKWMAKARRWRFVAFGGVWWKAWQW